MVGSSPSRKGETAVIHLNGPRISDRANHYFEVTWVALAGAWQMVSSAADLMTGGSRRFPSR